MDEAIQAIKRKLEELAQRETLIVLYQRVFARGGFSWSVVEVGTVIEVTSNTWPKYIDAAGSWSGPEEPAALGLATIWPEASGWEARYTRPDGGTCSLSAWPDRDAVIEAIRNRKAL